ncbi:MAG: hypothetical protein J6Q58_03000 [Clostridia bacterium]|nr:hypothetical protein [Clostridia bacterium]
MSTVNIKYGNNYHIKSVNGVIEVEFSDGNCLYKQIVTGEKAGEKTLIDYCEEKITLYDGTTLKRVRDMLTIV